MESLRGRRALVTGASRGIGRAIAEALAAEGVHVALLARTEAACADALKACKKHKVRALALGADVTDTPSLAAAINQAATTLGGLDLLVTSAGVAWVGPAPKAPEGAWKQMIDVNLTGSMDAARLALPYLRISSAGAIIFIGSVASRIVYQGGAGYCASKHGLLGFAGALFEELRAHKIKVSTVSPGAVDTDMTRGVHEPTTMLTPADVADAVLYVARSSPRACPTEVVLRCNSPHVY